MQAWVAKHLLHPCVHFQRITLHTIALSIEPVKSVPLNSHLCKVNSQHASVQSRDTLKLSGRMHQVKTLRCEQRWTERFRTAQDPSYAQHTQNTHINASTIVVRIWEERHTLRQAHYRATSSPQGGLAALPRVASEADDDVGRRVSHLRPAWTRSLVYAHLQQSLTLWEACADTRIPSENSARRTERHRQSSSANSRNLNQCKNSVAAKYAPATADSTFCKCAHRRLDPSHRAK